MHPVTRAGDDQHVCFCLLLDRPGVELYQIYQLHYQIKQKRSLCLVEPAPAVQFANSVGGRHDNVGQHLHLIDVRVEHAQQDPARLLIVAGQNRAYQLLLHLHIVDRELDVRDSCFQKPHVHVACLFLFHEAHRMHDVEVFRYGHPVNASPVGKLDPRQAGVGALQNVDYFPLYLVERVAPVHGSFSQSARNKLCIARLH